MTEQKRITKDMTIEGIFTHFPQKGQKLAQEMTHFGLHCVGCGAATWETLEAGMLGHGMNEKQVEELVGRLNAILDEELDLSTVTLTPTAAKKYLEILEEEGKKGWGLSLSEKAAGCSGFEYALDFTEKAKETDKTFTSEGIEIYVDKASLSRLLGSVIDYVDGLQGAGFKISNPNVKNSCGCGSSHNY